MCGLSIIISLNRQNVNFSALRHKQIRKQKEERRKKDEIVKRKRKRLKMKFTCCPFTKKGRREEERERV